MHLLYVDESGTPETVGERHFVLGGVAVFERQVYWLNKAVDEIAEARFPAAAVEFHAQEIAQHRKEPWHSLPVTERNALVDSLYGVLAGSKQANVTLFGVALEKTPTGDPMARAFEELCRRFDLYLARLHSQGDTQRGLIIFDESRYESHLQTLLREYRSMGTAYGRVRNFADVPFFADSRSTRLLQLADFVAYAVYRRYERGDTRLLDKIIHKFDTSDQVMHGLSHLSPAKATCTCPACLTRRLAGRQPENRNAAAGGDRAGEEPV